MGGGEDDYERKYMTEGTVLYRHRATPSRGFHLLMLFALLLPLAITTAAAFGPGAPWFLPFFALPSMLIMVPVWLLFSVLRIAVTKEHLHIQYGLFGPKIAMSAISSCEAVSYDWKKYGGFGIRRGLDGSTAYNLMGDEGRAVRVRWRDEKGKEQVTLVSAKDPDGLAAAVATARAQAGSPPAQRKRVAEPISPDRAAAIAEAEAEVEAELAAEAEGAGQAQRATTRRDGPG